MVPEGRYAEAISCRANLASHAMDNQDDLGMAELGSNVIYRSNCEIVHLPNVGVELLRSLQACDVDSPSRCSAL